MPNSARDHADLDAKVDRLLDTIIYATIATVSSKGEPWNTPVYFARLGREFFWISRADAQHSINIRLNGRAFLVVYDSTRDDASGAAVYVEADAQELADTSAIARALATLYQRKHEAPPATTEFRDPSPQRVFVAIAQHAWTNIVHTSERSPWDERVEISLGREGRQ